jgi:acyl carrier protein
VGKGRRGLQCAFTIRVSVKSRNAKRGKIDSLLFFIIAAYIGSQSKARQSAGWRPWKMSVDRKVQERVISLVSNILSANAIVVDVLPGSRLADIGMTSMDMVNLMLAVEAEFDMMIPQADITPENFQSPQSIERLVSKQIDVAA